LAAAFLTGSDPVKRQRVDADFVAHSAEARALADATEGLSRATGTLAIDPWNDAPERNRSDVIARSTAD